VIIAMGPYQNLTVWQKAMVLARDIYNVTANYPESETYGLVSQMRRCVVSIPSNIAEGYGRGTNRDLVHFLYTSLGSSNELETQLLLSREFSYLSDEDASMLLQLNEQINKMLSSLIYKRTQNTGSDFTSKPET
jgi:four helix bundle protein